MQSAVNGLSRATHRREPSVAFEPVSWKCEAEPRTRRLSILRIINRVTETSAPFNQFSLPLASKQDITLCTYYKSNVSSLGLDLHEGDGTCAGFFSALRSAFAASKPDLVHIHSPFVALLFLAGRMKEHRATLPIVVTVHNCFRNFKLRNRLFLLPIFYGCQRIVCCGRSSVSSLPELYRRIAGGRLTVIQNGVNLERVDQVLEQAQQRRGERGFTVVSVGRLKELKNPVTILRAFQRGVHPESRLWFIGDGELKQELDETARRLGVGAQTCFAGLIPREDVYLALARSDLFVSASRGEGLPIAALEAMACRRPVILSDIPPHREIAESLSCVPLIAADDVGAWAKEIGRFRQMAREEREAIGEECRRHVEQHFSVAEMNRQYEALYRELLDRNGRRQVGCAGVGVKS